MAAGALISEAMRDLTEGVGQHLTQDARVEHHHRARDGGHARGHQGEQLAAAQVLQIGAHEQRRLHHADEDVGDRAQRQGAADAHGLAQQVGERAHDKRQHPPVKQQRRERADQQHQRQGAKGEDEARAAAALGVWQVAAAEVTEDERGAGAGRLLEREQQVVQADEHPLERRHPQQRRGERELQRHAGEQDAPRRPRAVLAEDPGQREQHEDTEGALQDRGHGGGVGALFYIPGGGLASASLLLGVSAICFRLACRRSARRTLRRRVYRTAGGVSGGE